MLRRWQSLCVDKALVQYQDDQRHFFCQATPGAGKTRMSAELAFRMLNLNLIDLVICFTPSREVSQGFKYTLESVVGKRFDGRLGSHGAALTYQAMSFLDDNFWSLFQNFRVLAIFDEIHHCADHESGAANRWGQLIVQRIQDSATYTLAMSGTPWRSDELGIALARYSSPEGKLICDFRYGLSHAVADKVCRSPRIVLLDNEDVRLTLANSGSAKEKRFSSITDLLAAPGVRYQDLLENSRALHYMLSMANAQLDVLRVMNDDSAGLVVSSTIEHAWVVAEALASLGESATVVSSDSKDARDQIQRFRVGKGRWIVAVGMVAEGTDIPRIQVCCHLSRIRTELHFRQVLGRSLRRRGSSDAQAWMYVYAEPALSLFARRVAEDLPGDISVLSRENLPDKRLLSTDVGHTSGLIEELLDHSDEPSIASPISLGLTRKGDGRTLLFSEYFHHQLLSIFQG